MTATYERSLVRMRPIGIDVNVIFGSHMPLTLGRLITDSETSPEVVMLPITDAMKAPEKLGNSKRFYVGRQPAAPVTQTFGRFVANPKTDAFAKTEGRAGEALIRRALDIACRGAGHSTS